MTLQPDFLSFKLNQRGSTMWTSTSINGFKKSPFTPSLLQRSAFSLCSICPDKSFSNPINKNNPNIQSPYDYKSQMSDNTTDNSKTTTPALLNSSTSILEQYKNKTGDTMQQDTPDLEASSKKACKRSAPKRRENVDEVDATILAESPKIAEMTDKTSLCWVISCCENVRNNLDDLKRGVGSSIPRWRNRQISVADSEDSFVICFDDNSEGCNSVSDFDDEDDSDSEDETSETSVDSIVPLKKVRFATNQNEVFPMVQWSYAYKAARRGPWEEYARDRARFENRIRVVEENLKSVFRAEHRQRIFQERFVDDDTN